MFVKTRNDAGAPKPNSPPGGLSDFAGNKKTRPFLAAACVVAAVLSAGISALGAFKADPSRLVFGELLAPININIEIDRNFASNIAVFSESMDAYYYFLSPTTAPVRGKVVIHAEHRLTGFHGPLILRLPKERAEETIGAIDNISVFIGNKVFYFTGDDVARFEKSADDSYALFRFPEIRYAKSLVVKDWMNFYGDFNLALKLACAFFFSPERFIAAWIFLCALFFLYREELAQKYARIREKKYAAPALLAGITVFAFLLRVNGFVRHSAWWDELYSAAVAGDPAAPFLSVFWDSGNPPAYYLLLKYWLKLFGWNEASGTLFSAALGALACPGLYLFIEKNFDKKTALTGAFFMAVSGFAAGYSQNMRAYILKIALVPVIGFLFFRVLKKNSAASLALYAIPCVIIVNTHYYGILFVMANFIFYCGYGFSRGIRAADILRFFAANIVIALSFMPFFLYQILVNRSDFSREDIVLRPDHALIFALLAILCAIAFVKRKKISAVSFSGKGEKTAWLYLLSVPALIFTLGFLVSLKRPMLSYFYLKPVIFPFFLALAAASISALPLSKAPGATRVLLVLLLGCCLYRGRADILDEGEGFYQESLRYIALDTGAHPEEKAAVLDNAPYLSAFYRLPDLPAYSPDGQYDAVYAFNKHYSRHEQEIYNDLSRAGLDDSGILKIIPNEKIVIFKIFPNR